MEKAPKEARTIDPNMNSWYKQQRAKYANRDYKVSVQDIEDGVPKLREL